MYPYLKLGQGPQNSLSCFSALLDYCLSKKSLKFNKIIHAQLIKLGFNVYTYLGNRCLDLYSKFGMVSDVLKGFDDIRYKNSTSWNICLKGLLRSGHLEKASHLFDEMPVRDVVSWNTMISGYASHGFGNQAFQIFLEMQNIGTRPSAFTYTIMMSLLSSPYQGKQIHGRLIRSGADFSNLVLGNSLVNMYGNFGLVDYAFGVILTMNQLDIISWNSLIWACHSAGHQELALEQFHHMRSAELLPDQFTSSILISVCSNLQDLEKDWRILYSFLENKVIGTQLCAVP